MGKALADFGLQVGQQAIGAGMGLLLGKYNDKRQIEQQKKLNTLEMDAQRTMTNFNQQKQLEMWKATSYPGQKEQMQKAGLNPGLMYGMGGGGGQTANVETGQVTGGHAPSGGGEMVAMATQAAQLGLLRAQKENIEADTANKQADIPVKGATKTNIEASTTSIIQGVENQRAQKSLIDTENEIKKIQLDFDKRSEENRLSTVNLALSKIDEEINILKTQKLLDRATAETKEKLLKAELANTTIDSWLKGAEIRGINQGIIESARRVQNMIQENMRAWDQLSNENSGTDYERYKDAMNDKDFPTELSAILGYIFSQTATGGMKSPGKNPINQQNKSNYKPKHNY